MITLSLKESAAFLGTIDEADLQLLVDQLEEEHARDTDYYVCPTTIDILEQNGASMHLVRLLRDAVGDTDGVEVAWSRG
ncbi:MAG: galactosyldiacylglycerol synthase [Gammaproteobacteria bacterium]|nr:galactosyldiacylglycerol synthase [Gammaproteobacteria bacterium]